MQIIGIIHIQEVIIMKGYSVENGYMGFVEGRYMLFSCEDDYLDYIA